ncbi:hypothetical protein C2845_PM05G17000 [Panicum miliaceum]|uniref:Uncharacterized protein n=1 Tax=Panicum miliaceum TaxID=4540 RepID=A0A3L6SW97_PANMI|nr:hypothetical protein C2845_PM05G17000 [Panicum miliaceum]
MSHAMHQDDLSIVGEFKAQDLHSWPAYFSVAWQLNKESKEHGLCVAFNDPQHFSATVIAQRSDHDMRDDKNKLEKQQLLAIREKVAQFLLADVISDKDDSNRKTCRTGCEHFVEQVLNISPGDGAVASSEEKVAAGKRWEERLRRCAGASASGHAYPNARSCGRPTAWPLRTNAL